MKVKSKIGYLGEKNSLLPGQMAEQLAVEVIPKKCYKNTLQSHRKNFKSHYFLLFFGKNKNIQLSQIQFVRALCF